VLVCLSLQALSLHPYGMTHALKIIEQAQTYVGGVRPYTRSRQRCYLVNSVIDAPWPLL
jgi:hypothetical protein